MSTNDSARIRRQIGFFKKQIQRLFSAAQLSLTEYDILITTPNFQKLDDDELETLRLEITSARSNLLKSYSKLTKLHSEWTLLLQSNPGEQQIFDDYLEKCGDYRTIIDEAVKQLENMDTLLNSIEQEYSQRHLTISSASSETNTQDEDRTQPSRSILMTNNQIPSASQPFMINSPTVNPLMTNPLTPNASLMNFVDASILSKLELPTFDGNLLEYPEFASRFATLVGNKTQLDDTTKFSLLKSCLRGRALHTIQGLSMTPENYRIAMDILKTHFDDKVTMRHILYTKLAQLPNCDPEGRNLLALYNRMFALIRQFSANNDDAQETALGAILLNKLPARVRSRIYDKTANDHNLSPTELLHLLTDIVRKDTTLYEMNFHSKTSNTEQSPYVSLNATSKYQKNAKRTRTQQQMKPCPYCEQANHSAVSCDVFLTPYHRNRRAKEQRLCYNCLSKYHSTKECTSKRSCKYCKQRHHTSMCFSHSQQQLQQPSQATDMRSRRHEKPHNLRKYPEHQHCANITAEEASAPTPVLETSEDATPTSITYSSTLPPDQQPKPRVALMCATVNLYNPSNASLRVQTTAFLDSGSSHSYITDDIAEILQLPTLSTEMISVSTFGSKNLLRLRSRNHKIGISTNQGEKVLEVKSLPTITGNFAQIQHTQDIQTTEFVISDCKPSLLIGSDYFWEMILSDDFYVKILTSGCRLLHTNLGNILTGKLLNLKDSDRCTSLCARNDISNPTHHDKLTELVSKFWNLESIGIIDDPTQKDDDICLKFFNDTVSFDSKEQRYIVKLPFKSDPSTLPDNYTIAYSRLSSLVKCLSRNPGYMQEYNKIFKEQLERGIIENVPKTESMKHSHYLSHHGVIKQSNEKLKIRCVFDGSAKLKGSPSINEILHRGPVLLPDLAGILIRCRFPEILITSDVEKAFLMVGLHPDCRDYTRFLWLHDVSKPFSSENVITYRFTRVLFGLICSPFLLSGTIHHHLTTVSTPLSQDLLRNTYVDNVFHGVTSIEEGMTHYNDSRKLFVQAGMNLRTYVSNSPELNKFFITEEKSQIATVQKLLGIHWDISTDEIFISLPQTPAEGITWTKRKILKEIASIYDPLGFITPVTLLGKLFLQSLWKIELKWDHPLPGEKVDEWKELISQWTSPTLKLKRRILENCDNSTMQFDLHVFTDASKNAFCATAYLVQTFVKPPHKVSFIMSKSRLAPLRQSVTMPRLELSALVIGAKLLNFVSKQLDIYIREKFLWSDNTIALNWAQSRKELPVFVRNRVKTIQELTSDVTLKYIPTEWNPADIASRGATITELLQSSLWWHGPDILTQDKSYWFPPLEGLLKETTHSPVQQRLKTSETKTPLVSLSTNITQLRITEEKKCLSPFIETSRFSTWNSLLLTVVFVLRFLVSKSRKAAKHFGTSRAVLHSKAEIILFRLAQNQDPPSGDHMKQLHLFRCKTTSLWRSKGRIEKALLAQEAITPTFLPTKNRITALFILHTHTINNHCGVNHTLTELRQKVWIPKGRSAVKKVISNDCFHCKRYRAKPFVLPPFPILPKERVVRPHYPFENVGMDIFGPLSYRTKDKMTEKYWGLLFTCLNTRAVHVDVILDMTTRTILHTLRRFIATNGCPTWIVCDNAQSFKSIAECYSSLPDQANIDEDVLDYCAQKKIQMKFIPSLSPWQGGVYEKMIDIFKKSFRHAIGNSLLDIEEIMTLLKEAQAIVNTRPLTYITDDQDSLPLRPIDFLHPYAKLAGSYPEETSDEWTPITTTRETLLSQWRITSEMLTKFWKRWNSEYLTSLREQYKTEHEQPRSHEHGQPNNGDYVIIEDANLDRGQWKMGQIIGSRDDFKRSVQVRLPSKRIITRPNNMIYKLEIESTKPPQAKPPSTNPTPSRHQMVTRSKARQQAMNALLCITPLSSIHFANTRCPDEINTEKTVLYATHCAQKGVAVAKIRIENKEKLCWFPIYCPHGAIHFQQSSETSTSLCGRKCECPQWSSACSYTENYRKEMSNFASLPPTLSHYRPSHVCSFEPSSTCDQTLRIGTFNQVQLFDNTTLLVEHLDINIQDYIDEDDFICVDRKGWRRDPTNALSGTSTFCKKHHCEEKARLFCIYDNPLATLVVNESSHATTPIILKAWGTITKTYYEHMKTTPTTQAPLQVKCSQGGVSVASEKQIETIEVCIANYCTISTVDTFQRMLFPNSLVTYDYTAKVQAFHKGQRIFETNITCTASPICETIQCTACWEWIHNSQCWTYPGWSYIIVFIAMVTISAPLLCCVMKGTCHLLTFLCRTSRRVVNSLCKFCIRKPKDVFPRRYISKRKRNTNRKLLTSAVLILLQTHGTQQCSQFTSITAKEGICSIQDTKETCVFNEATLITLQPLKQETCLGLYDENQINVGIISITLDSIRYRCNKRIEFFSRDHELVSESSHRCYSAGSCTENACDNTKPTDELEEFSSTANNNPGYTYCASSCGCVTCNGCFLCNPSCLFYRVYAKTTSPSTYTIFNCPSWDFSAIAKFSLTQENSVTSTTLQLTPGRTTTWNNLRVTLIGSVTPQLPILSSTFITDGKKVAIVKSASKGQLIPHTVGQLQCSSIEDAKNFNCQFSSKACTCTKGLLKASCVCSEGDIEKLMHVMPLPQKAKNFHIYEENKDIYAKINLGSALQLHLVAEDLKITSKMQESSCTVETGELHGCYSCASGAMIEIICKTNEGETTATIECATQSQTARCTTQGHLNTLVFHFDTDKVSTTCTFTCPKTKTNITIRGSLEFPKDNLIKADAWIDNEIRKIPSNTSAIESFLNTIIEYTRSFSAFFTYLKYAIFLIFAMFILSFLFRIKRYTFSSAPTKKHH